jgi:hypothetical protein
MNIFETIKKHYTLASIIGTAVTLITIIFGMGQFYNRFTSLETNVNTKIETNSKITKVANIQMTSRIDNLEKLTQIFMQQTYNKIDGVKTEVKKNHVENKKLMKNYKGKIDTVKYKIIF